MLLLIISISLAADLPGEELFVAEPQNTKIQIQETSKSNQEILVPSPFQVPKSSTKKSKRPPAQSKNGNLPNYFRTRAVSEVPNSELIQKPTGSSDFFKGIKVGDTLEVLIGHSVIAFPDEKSPVVAVVGSSSFRGLRLIGESNLERNSKRIFINFDRFVVGDQVYKVKASGVSTNGQPGLSGQYYSREAEYFAGDFLSSFVAGYFDGLVPRKTNVFGEVQEDKSVDSAVKKGLASGALSSAERFKEKLKRVPEFSEIKGPIELKVLILEQPKRE